jgi:hypothetical protein
MLDSMGTMATQTITHLDRFVAVQRAGLDCVDALTKLNAATARNLIDHVGRQSNVDGNGSLGALAVGVSKTIAEHWEASFSFVLQTQQHLIASLGAPTQSASAKQK